MSPTLVDGQIILAYRPLNLKVGDVVIFKHRNLEKIKRISKISANKIFLTGDNPTASTDSRSFGWMNQDRVKFKVLLLRDRVG
ncbi:S26 family signal peptidase [Candidatus Saccharibacteria bacterium]|nr:MAG: S26 family signal peptidase [Candidatus Saccharibacteria bacterium]